VDKIILTDIDGVVFDWHTAFVKWMELQGYSSTGVIHHDAEIHNEFGISLQEATVKREEFNASMACSILEPMRQSEEFIKKLHEEGFHFIAITSLSDKPIAQYYRYLNLEDYFDTDVFVDVKCLPAGAPKMDALEEFQNTKLIYIDDRISNLEDALKCQLKPVMMKHAYNIHYNNGRVHQVSNWADIYKYVQEVYKKQS
tara:strand:+ start:1681 stop:2277 length:597 start_codon:yes stop_codon:yes gene_type:complete